MFSLKAVYEFNFVCVLLLQWYFPRKKNQKSMCTPKPKKIDRKLDNIVLVKIW